MAAMGYIKEPFVLTLAPGDKHSVHHSFFATLFEKRENVPTNQMSWATVAQHTFQKAVERGGKLEAASLLIDARGGVLLVDFRGNISTSNATSALANVLEDFPPEQRSLALETLFPVDELTKERIEGMLTVAACEPPPCEQESDADEPPTEEALIPMTSLVPIQTSIMACTAKVDEVRASGRIVFNWARMVQDILENWCIKNANPKFFDLATNRVQWSLDDLEDHILATTDQAKANTERYKFWAENANNNATVVVASVGVHSFTYERCYKPARCELLLAKRLTSSATLLQTARTAWNMAVLGQLKTPTTQKQKLDFGKLCSKVVTSLNPKTPNLPKDLTDSERRSFQAILNGNDDDISPDDPPFEGCFNCLDAKPEWVTTDQAIPQYKEAPMPVSRCAKCNNPKAFGRSIKGLGDILAPSLKRQRGLEAHNHHTYFGR
jgi:hypothetical protein